MAPVERGHAAGDAAALEGRARRAGRGEQALAVADDELGVRADVEERRELVALGEAGGEQARRGVGADVAADERQAVDARLRVDRQPQPARLAREARGRGAAARGAPPRSRER